MITLREKKEHGTPSVPVVPYEPWMGRERGHHATVETHWHDEWEICYIETGRIECTLNGESCPMEAGDAVFIPGGILHSMKPVDGCHWIFESVVFNPSLLELNSDMFGESKYIGRFRTESNRRAAIFRDAAFNERYLRMYSALNEKVPFYELL
ncbi:MAG: AraC family ligand binding domain-containing protein, partial [Clostridiales bacterium]|nr:AraC family ligand binding domain-containing protein [Clostridiales bacterium]